MRIRAIYYSPTYSTKKLALYIAKGLNTHFTNIDITPYEAMQREYEFDHEDFLIIGLPVFGGRLPEDSLLKIKNIKGNHTKAFIFVTYGNREYDDALLELSDILLKQGIEPIGFGSIICEHSIYRKIASNRPDKHDYEKIDAFLEILKNEMNYVKNANYSPIKVPGNYPYREFDGIPLKIRTKDDACILCLLCAKECPAQAIPRLKPQATNHNLCTRCMRCQYICPTGARDFPVIQKKAGEFNLRSKTKERKEVHLKLAKRISN